MQELLDWLEYIEDDRQQRKVRHTLKDILVIVLFATLANADDWVEMALFAESYQDYLRKYIELKNGIFHLVRQPLWLFVFSRIQLTAQDSRLNQGLNL